MARCGTGLQVQTIIFPSTTWSRARARKWLKKYGAKTPKADVTENFFRYRQRIPAHFKKGTFKTISLGGRGVKAVVGCPQDRYKRSNPMPTILAMNPKKKKKKPAKGGAKKKSTKKGVKKMAKKKGKKKGRKNPGAGRYTAATLGGVNFVGALKSTIPLLAGAIMAKFTAKRFATGGGEMEDWDWKNYLLALTGGLVGAIATSALIRTRGKIAQKIFEGAVLLVLYKIFTTELAPKNSTLSAWFSGNEEELTEYGQVWQGDEAAYMTGADNFYRPLDESHRAPEAAGFGGEIVPADPVMGGFGDEVVAAGPVMGGYGYGQDVDVSPAAAKISQEFQQAYGG